MKRFWVIFTMIFALFMFPVLSQSNDTLEDETLEEETLEGEETPSGPSGETTGASETGEATVSGGPDSGVMWTDKNGTIFANSKVRFVLQASDGISEVDFIEYQVDKSDFQKYTGKIQILEDGPHTITYRAVDKAGNREVDRVYNITIDNKAPQIMLLPARPFFIKEGRNYSSQGNSFTLRILDEYSGVKSSGYGINGSELKAYNDEVISLSSVGTQMINVNAEDNLRNKTINNFVIEVDGEKPTVNITPTNKLIQIAEKQYAKRRTGFNVTGDDKGSGIGQIMVRIDGSQEWQIYTETLYFKDEKSHTIEAKAIDNVGNESEVSKLTFVTDDNAPKTEIKTEVE
jgi:hypothetical protein